MAGGRPVSYLQSVEEFNLEPPKSNTKPSSGSQAHYDKAMLPPEHIYLMNLVVHFTCTCISDNSIAWKIHWHNFHIHKVETQHIYRLEFYLEYFRYLVDLDYQGDPAWECLVHQKEWLLKLLTNCQEDHKSKGK